VLRNTQIVPLMKNYYKNKILAVVLFFVSLSSIAQTITTSAIAPTTYCAGGTISVPYTITGSFTAGNVFTVELSSSTGTFPTGNYIGTLSSTSAGTITATIPGGTATAAAYKVRVISSNPSITGSASATTLTISAPPTAVAGTAVATCGTIAVNVTAGSSVTNNASLAWTSSGTGTFANSTSITTATYTPSAADVSAGSVTLTLTANPNGTCTAVTSTKTLTITPAPTVASGTAIATCGTAAVNITTGSSATNYNTITWTSAAGTGTFANNNSLTATTYTPSAADVTAGTRTLTLTATGNGTCANVTSTKNITITAPPTAVAGTAVATCGTIAVNVTAGSSVTNNASLAWTSSGTGTFTNSTSITTATYTPSAADISAGSVTLTLTANPNGTCTAVTSTKTLTITTAPTVAAGTAIATCGAAAVNITTGSSAANYNTITWTSSGTGTFANNNSLTATTYTPSAADITAGSRTLTLTATGNGTCTSVISTKTITITPAPTAVAGAAFNTCSTSGAVGITTGASSTNNSGINWTSSGTGTFANQTSITTATYTPSAADIAAGSVVLTLTASPNGTCTAATSTKTLTITTLPVATFSYTGTPYCTSGANPTPTFTGGGVAGTFSSTGGLGFVSTSTGVINLATVNPGTTAYTITNTIPASGGCVAVVATSAITINSAPVVTTQPVNSSTCSGNTGSVTFTVAATGTGLTYQWLEDGLTLSNGGIYGGVTTTVLTLTNPTVSHNYSVVVSGTCANTTSNAAVFTANAQSAPGTPTVFGNGVWNAYCYASINFTNYVGYYTENNLSFNTTNRYPNGSSPSLASGYQGCSVPATNMSVSFKQTNFTPATYNVNLTDLDDGFTMFVNGTQVYTAGCCIGSSQPVFWTGNLGATDQVELRWTQGGGGSYLGINFATTTTPASTITPGSIAGNQSVCSGGIPAQILSSVTAATTTGCSLGSYQWYSSPDSATWTPVAGATAATYTISSALTQTTWYYRIANGACGAVSVPSNAVKVTVYSTAPGNPTVFGNSVWNCYVYGAINFTTYDGYYVEPLFSFDTRNRWGSGLAPSLASGYQGCVAPATNMSISMKQTNFTPGTYSLSVNFQDDGFTMLLNGVQVFQNNNYTPTVQSNVWTGNLGATDQVELRFTQGGGGSGLSLTFTPVTPPVLLPGTISGNQHVCSSDIPQLPLSNVTAASGGCSFQATSYQWQSSPDSLTWTNISGANASSYTIPATLTATTYYQRLIIDNCAQSVASNVVKVTLDNIVYGDPTAFGSNVWNCYAYKDNAFTTYAGYYTEPLTSFSSINRYTKTQSPSYASGYLGCNVPTSNFSLSMKRQGLPSSSTGIFQIDLDTLDDTGTLLINGAQVYTKTCCVTSPITNIWTGPIGSTDQIEWRWVGLTAPNYTALHITEVTPTALLAGTITGSDTICAGNIPAAGFTTVTAPSGGCYFNYYQWQYSTDSTHWTNLSSSNTISYTPVLSIYQKTWYRRVAYDICGNSSATLPVVVNMKTTAPGNPTVYGANTWNAYCYNDNSYAQYVGYYTENNLSFNTTNRYANTLPPSTAMASGGSLGYSGCQQLNTYWAVDFKRQGLGASPAGYYQIDVNYQDDGAAILINGTQVFSNPVYTPTLQSNVWTGQITSSTLLEIKFENNAGPGQLQVTFTYLGTTPPTNLVAGTLTCSPTSFCSGDLPYINSATPASGGCAVSYQWQSSPDNATWTNITGATSLNFNSITAITATTYYRRTATDACGNIANTASCMLTTNATVTNPGTGNNTWNCLVYNASDFTSNYSGYYTEPLLSFATANRFATTAPPSYASGYQGCQVSAATYSVRMLRTNFTPATYQIDIPTHDDNMALIINGIQVYSATCCTSNLTAVWVGNLGATDVVELRYVNFYGPGNLSANFTVVTPTGTITPSVIGSDQIICYNTAPAAITTTTAATSFCYLSYQWQSSTTSISSGYSNISGATAVNYTPGALTQTTYYRILITDACGNSAYSNATTITVDAAVVAATNGVSQTICSGQIPTSITANPTGGSGTYTYQWYSSINNITYTAVAGATSQNFAPASITQNTWYEVQVTSCGSTITSTPVAVTVSPATAITTQPVSIYTGCLGTTGTFTIAATGSNLNYQWQQSINGGAYTNVGTNSTSYSTTIIAAMSTNTYTYQCVVTSTCSPTSVTSSTVTISPNVPTISTQPVAATTCSGSATPVTFSISATGSSTTYQWYNAAGNIALTNAGIYSGVTTSTLTITGATATASYYCIPGSTCGSGAQSSTVALTVQPVISNNTISSNQSICGNGTVAALTGTTPAGGGGTYTYQWSSATALAGPYTAISGATAASYTPTGLLATTYFQRTVSSTTCVSNISNTVTITVTTQPATPTITGTTIYCVGSALSLTANTAGAASYAWTTVVGTGFSGTATANLTNSSIQTTNAGTYKVTATIGSCTSLPASTVITVNKLPAITTQPAATTTTCVGSGVNIAVVATGAGLTYQWQQSPNGTTYTNIVNNGVYNNATTATLYLIPTNTTLSGYSFRCVVSGTCTPSVTSTSSVFTVNNTITANTVTAAQQICGNSTPATLTGSSPSGGTGTFAYQWYSSPDNATWTPIAGGTSINYSPGALTQSTYYYRSATSVPTNGCGVNNSSSVLITVYPSTNIGTQPVTATTCPTVPTTMSVAATGASLTYRWQVNPLTGTYTNISNAALYSGYLTTALTFTNPSYGMNGYLYRCIITGNCGSGGYSIDTTVAVPLTVYAPATITTQPVVSQSICAGNNTSYSVIATGSGTIGYQWQQRIGGGPYTNLSDGGVISGSATNVLNLTGVPIGYNGNYYRCVLTLNGCSINTPTTDGLLTVKAIPTVTASANPTSICVGQNSTLKALGANTYVWNTGQSGSQITVSPSATTTYTVTGTAVNGCTNTATTSVTANPVLTPSVTINPVATTVCAGSAAVFTAVPTNGGSSPSFLWKVNGGSVTTNSPSNTTFTSTTLHNNDVVTLYMTSNVLCGNPLNVISAPITMTVNPLPLVSVSVSPSNSICVGQSVTLSGSGNSDSYSWNNGITDGVAFIPASTTMYSVTGTIAATGCTNTVNQTITVNSPVAQTITGASPLCIGFTNIYTSTTSGGTWTSANPSVAAINSGTGHVTALSAGTSDISYSVTTAGGCINNAIQTLTVTAPVTQIITGNSNLCVGLTTTYSSTSSGGTWNSGSISKATVDPVSGLVTGIAAGSTNISYSVTTSGGCVNTASQLITITSPVAQTLSGATILCVGGTSTYSSNRSGGTWTSSVPAVATIDPSTGLLTAVSGGTSSIGYSVTTAGGCVNTANQTITVIPTNTAGAASSTPTVCISTALTNITIATTGATGIGSATGLPSGVTAAWASNTITISGTPTASGIFNYSIPLTGGCGSVNATGTITVTPANTAGAASSTPTVCINTALTNITIATTGATGIGSATGLPAGVTAAWASNTITISGTLTASGNFNYSIPLTGGCGSVNATGTITVAPANTAGTPSTTPILCINTTLTNITIATTGATGIGSSTGLPAGVTAAWAGNTITISGTPTASGTFNYSIPLTGGCGSVNATGSITVIATVTQVITGTTPLCKAIPSTYTSTTAGGTWTSGSPSVATINSVTGLVNGVSAGTSLISYSVITAGGCVNTATKLVTINSCAYGWAGAINTDWNTATNWLTNLVPTSGDSVVIPSGVTFMPIITGTANAAKITVSSGASLTIGSGGTLNTYGNLVDNGIIATFPGSTLSLQGSSAQTISGSSSISLYNMNVNNAAGVSISTPVTVNGTLSLPSGVLTTNNDLTINFDNGGNIAYSATDAGSVNSSGTITGVRSLINGTHYVSAPFSGVTIGQIAATNPIYRNGYWLVNTKTFATQGWAAVTSLTTPMTLGEGFSLGIFTPSSLKLTGTYTHNLTVTSPAYSNAKANQYFMFGNPYPSTIDWDNASGWSNTNIGGAIYYWNPANSTVSTYVSGAGTNGGSNLIPAMQAIMVTTTGSGGTSGITVNPLSRNTTSSSFFRTVNTPTISLEVVNAAGQKDQTLIRFNDLASTEYEPAIDAVKFMNPSTVPSLYTVTGTTNTNVAINTRPIIAPGEIIPLNLRVVLNGTYTLRCSQFNVPGYQILLVDKFNNSQTVLDTTLNYTISSTYKDSLDRFELRLAAITTSTQQPVSAGPALQIYTSPNGFLVAADNRNAGKASIQILDAAGRQLKTLNDVNLQAGNNFFQLEDVASGVYLIRVNTINGTYVQQISVIK